VACELESFAFFISIRLSFVATISSNHVPEFVPCVHSRPIVRDLIIEHDHVIIFELRRDPINCNVDFDTNDPDAQSFQDVYDTCHRLVIVKTQLAP